MLPLASLRALAFASLLLCFVSFSSADTLKITSSPPGATVELDGVAVGSTPFEKNFPGGYFHRTRTALHAPATLKLPAGSHTILLKSPAAPISPAPSSSPNSAS
jgi:PEGA domain